MIVRLATKLRKSLESWIQAYGGLELCSVSTENKWRTCQQHNRNDKRGVSTHAGALCVATSLSTSFHHVSDKNLLRSSIESRRQINPHSNEEHYSTIEKWKIFPEEHEIDEFNAETEDTLTDPWYFIHGSDPQYGFNDYMSDNPNMDEEIQITEKLVQKINNLDHKPRFVLITGDLVNEFPSSNYSLFKLEEQTFKKVFGQLNQNVPVFVACGNHDIGDCPTKEDLAIYKECWGDDYYSFWCGGVFFLVINSQYYKDAAKVLDYARQHEQWINEQLEFASKINNARIIVVQHIPWFIKSASEPDNYFTISSSIRNIVLDKFADAGVQMILCGHYHRNAVGKYKNIEVVVTSALCGPWGHEKPGVRFVKVYKNTIKHVYYCVDDIPSSVDL